MLHRNCLRKNVTEGKIERKRRGGRRRKKLLEGLKGHRRYSNLKEGALDPNLSISRFGRC
jgi:hypothetical protein